MVLFSVLLASYFTFLRSPTLLFYSFLLCFFTGFFFTFLQVPTLFAYLLPESMQIILKGMQINRGRIEVMCRLFEVIFIEYYSVSRGVTLIVCGPISGQNDTLRLASV